jgi:beta-lactamase regulating signal transducer with metallopeptidase domain
VGLPFAPAANPQAWFENMHSLLQILLSNAVGAGVLSLVVWLVSLVCRKPALVRALWIVVLLKLLTPPVFTVSVDRWLQRAAPTSRSIVPAAAPVLPLDRSQITVIPRVPDAAPPVKAEQRISPATLALQGLPILWLAGSAWVVLIALSRAWALSRTLKQATPADESAQSQAACLAARLGLVRGAKVWLVPGVVCPALWAFGRMPRIIIPLELWQRLDEAQQSSVLAHELAHLRRGDHWVRLLELIVTVLYWWHPAVWLGRRQIHDCEEQCCDAWVLWAMPASAHAYGAALLEAVEFVSTHRPTRPALAAGLGEFRHLKRRLLMIKKQSVARALSRAGLLWTCLSAAVALPVGPLFAQVSPPGAEGQSAEQAEATARGERQIAEARARVERLEAQLAEARSRLALLEQAAGLPPARAGAGLPPGAPMGGLQPGMPGMGGPATGMPGRPGATAGIRPPSGGYGGVMGGGGEMGGAFGGGGFGNAGGGTFGRTRSPQDARLDRLEKQLRELMEQVRELKDEKGTESREQRRSNNQPGPATSALPMGL